MKSITLVTFKRAEYTEEVLRSIAANNTEGYELFIGVDPGHHLVYDVINNFLKRDCIKTTVIHHRPAYGVNFNNQKTYERAFACGSKFNVCVEDDTPLTSDALELANWFAENGDEYLLLNLFTKSFNDKFPNLLYSGSSFCPWAYCITRTKYFQHLKGDWMKDQRGWDWSINRVIRKKNLPTLHVTLSRSWNIGREQGTHCTPRMFDEEFPPELVFSQGGYGRDFQICSQDQMREKFCTSSAQAPIFPTPNDLVFD